jgi:hypothetical protein
MEDEAHKHDDELVELLSAVTAKVFSLIFFEIFFKTCANVLTIFKRTSC